METPSQELKEVEMRTSEGGISIGLLDSYGRPNTFVASFAARTCYAAELPKIGEVIDVKEQVYSTGHHTTLQHWYMTYVISGIPVGLVDFCYHLGMTFYDTDQQSGRYSKMYSRPDYPAMKRYIMVHWPEVSVSLVDEVIDYIKCGVEFYEKGKTLATELCKKYLLHERPFITAKELEVKAAKVAQEQLRMLIPVIVPTNMVFTINVAALVSLWTVAWSPDMRVAMDMMRDIFLEKNPDMSYMFDSNRRRNMDWVPGGVPMIQFNGCLKRPQYTLKEVSLIKPVKVPDASDMHPLDLLQYDPDYLDNKVNTIKGQVHISLATMGQDQRHRTIGRTAPSFTGYAYLPPLLVEAGLEADLSMMMSLWGKLSQKLPGSLSAILAPYGAMVTYEKEGDLNDLAHEMEKRLCFSAQEEISEQARQMRNQVLESNPELSWMFAPACLAGGKCGEGKRYCGRDFKNNPGFPERKV